MSLRHLLLVVEPGKDGVLDYVATLVVHFRRFHPEVKIDLAYSSKRSGPNLAKLVEDIRQHEGVSVDLKVSNGPQPGDVRAGREIWKLVHARQPQLIHCHSSKAGALCRILGFISRKFPPVVYTPHAYYGLAGKRTFMGLVFNMIESGLGRVGYTVNSSHDERCFGIKKLYLPPRKLVLVNNGIDVERFHPADKEMRKKYRAQFGFPEQAQVVVSIGRDSFQKNFPPLYQTFDRILSASNLDAFFAHAGAGSDELGRTLSPLAQKRFRSFAHLDDVESLLFCADAFILTSRYEGLSLGVLQAISCGLKIFLSRVTGNTSLQRIGFDEITWIEPTENQDDLADRIEKALRAWLARPTPPSERQVSLAHQNIATRIQLEKVYRLYHHLVQRASTS